MKKSLKMIHRFLLFIKCITVIALFMHIFSCTARIPVTDYVDPFIGTDGTGHTFPGATLPFGMVQLSPDTRDQGWENCSGYHSSNPTILGFSHTHLSGTGAIDYGDILVMPMSGNYHLLPGDELEPENGYRSAFDHATEIAEPGYYAVTLKDNDIRAEMTVSQRVGLHRYTFQDGESPYILFDLYHGLGDKVVESAIEIINDEEIAGMRRSTGWAKDQYIYFYARFSRPFTHSLLFKDEQKSPEIKSLSGQNIKGIFEFEHSPDPILVKIGISAVDRAGAFKNLLEESYGWDFDYVRLKALQAWEKELSAVEIKGGSKKEKINFYTALYHFFIAPNLFHDVDGRYRGADLNVHTLPKGESNYTVFSLWDTFRATHPLFTLLKPALAEELVRTLIKKAEEGDLMPVWELAGNETGTMIGYHSIPVIADAYMKGLRNFDHKSALQHMIKSSMQDHLGLDAYKTKGYISLESENESVSKTLEYAYDDWCIAVMAEKMGKKDIAESYFRRSQNYMNLFDKETGFFRGKKLGNWVEPFDPREVNSIYTEANAWQYLFFVPHDLNGLVELMGGEAAFSAKLDSLFSTTSNMTGRTQLDITGMIGQYAHGNEPSHHFAYLYNFVGQAYKTQDRVRQIIDTLYNKSRNGLCGNEDCGQMSAWYVFSAMGFYPVVPGKDFYVLGSPIFDEVTIHLENGKTFIIETKNNAKENKYVESLRLNDTDYPKTFISHQDLTIGGKLTFTMSPKPNVQWGADSENRPKSIVQMDVVLNPTISAPAKTFLNSMTLKLECGTQDAKIFYTLDGSTPSASSRQYYSPIQLTRTTTIKAIAMKDDFMPSNIETEHFYQLPYEIKITYHEPYNSQYTAGGNMGLFDSVRGYTNAWGSWQGFYDRDFYATIDLGAVRNINSVTTTFLQNVYSWIWLPQKVTYEISTDGQKYSTAGSINHSVLLNEYEARIMDFVQPLTKPVRFIRIHGKNIGVCPDWHPGAGNPTWLFIDEIVFK